MRAPLPAVLLAAALLSVAAAARANEDPEASLAAVRSSLQALKTEDAAPEKARGALAALSASAARLKPANAPAAAALERLKTAVRAAGAPDAKDLAALLKQVDARGDELLAALEGSSGTSRVTPRSDPQVEKRLAMTQPQNVSDRSLKVMNGGFDAKLSPSSVSPVGPTIVSPNVSAGGVSYLPAGAMHGASDLGIAVPGPNQPVVQTPSGFQVFAAAFDERSYAPAAAAALEHLRGYMMVKPPGMPSLDGVARTSRFAAENFLIHFDLPAFITEPRGRNQPLTFVTPSSIKAVGFQAPLPPSGPVTGAAHLSATTIEPQVGGILPSRAKARHTVEGGATLGVNGIELTASASVSARGDTAQTVGNPTYKGQLGLADGLKLSASYRAAGGRGEQPRAITAGVVQELGGGQTLRADFSVLDKTPGDTKGKDNFYAFQAGYHLALNAVP